MPGQVHGAMRLEAALSMELIVAWLPACMLQMPCMPGPERGLTWIS